MAFDIFLPIPRVVLRNIQAPLLGFYGTYVICLQNGQGWFGESVWGGSPSWQSDDVVPGRHGQSSTHSLANPDSLTDLD